MDALKLAIEDARKRYAAANPLSDAAEEDAAERTPADDGKAPASVADPHDKTQEMTAEATIRFTEARIRSKDCWPSTSPTWRWI